jgi:hypothetical protein
MNERGNGCNELNAMGQCVKLASSQAGIPYKMKSEDLNDSCSKASVLLCQLIAQTDPPEKHFAHISKTIRCALVGE